jgi:transcriptional regulator with XRE-family HTH domain
MLREEKGVKLRELSKQLDVSLPYLSDVERGERDPLSNSRILRVALFLNVDPMPLLAVATKERERVVLDVPKGDDLRIQAAMMLSLWWPEASAEMLGKLQDLIRAHTPPSLQTA